MAMGIVAMPDSIIERIQLLLPDEDRLRSCLLSKSWLRLYSTLPLLKFVENRFAGDRKMFLRAVNDILVRYRRCNLRIETLEIILQHKLTDNIALVLLIQNWLDLATEDCNLVNLSLQFSTRDDKFEFPVRFFNAKTLRKMRMANCRVESKLLPMWKISSSLVTLELEHVVIMQPVLDELLSNCPFIEKLVVNWCSGFHHVTIGGTNHKHLKEFHTEWSKNQVSGVVSIPYNIWILWFKLDASHKNLTYLEIASDITGMFLTKLLLSLPFLTGLVLRFCTKVESFNVKHDVLGHLNIRGCHRLREVNIDCPKLKSFVYADAEGMPHLSFTDEVNLAGLETRITQYTVTNVNNLWFDGLYEAFLSLGGRCSMLSVKFNHWAKVGICSGRFGKRLWLPPVDDVYLEVPRNMAWVIGEIKDTIHSICNPMNMTVREFEVS